MIIESFLLLYCQAFLARQPVLTTGDYRRLRQRYIIGYVLVMGTNIIYLFICLFAIYLFNYLFIY
jgi:hypothetical protein